MKKSKIRPAFKNHGGKFYISQWLIDLFPANYEQMIYLEPYCGAASVFLNKKKSNLEILNDINFGVINIMQMLQNKCEDFVIKLNSLKYSQETFDNALRLKNERQISCLDEAVNEFVLRRMSRGGLKKAFAWSDRLRGGKPGDVNAWETILKTLPKISERLQGIALFNKTAIEMLDEYNQPNVLVYLDPPYLHETRVSVDCYDNEMTEKDHVELSKKLNAFKGNVMISGYHSELYDNLYKKWQCFKKQIVNHSSQQKTKKKKTECCWLNFNS